MPDITSVKYNDINLGQVTTRTFSQNPIYDSMTSTDVVGYQYDLAFQFLLSVSDNGISAYGPVDLAEDISELTGLPEVQVAFNRLDSILSTPRKRLILEQNGTTILDTGDLRNTPQLDSEDDFNGPIPGALRLVGMFSAKTMILEWSCVVRMSGVSFTSSSQSAGSDPVPLSIKYTQDQDINERGYSTIHTSGELKSTSPIFRDASFNSPATVDSLRRLVYPVLLPGYIRKSKYTVSADGTVLRFNFTDRQLDTMPPVDAYEASGNFGISGSGGIWHGEMNLTLKGGKNTSKQKLIEVATAICLSRVMKTTGRNIKNRESWNALWGKSHGGVSFKEDLFDCSVSVAMRFLIPPKDLSGKRPNQNAVNAVIGAFSGAFFSVAAINPALAFGVVASTSSWKNSKKGTGQSASDKDAIAQQTGNASPSILVPNDAIKQIGSELPGVTKRGVGISAGGIRGEKNDVVLLVAGFMRDPGVPQDLVSNPKNLSGIRGPYLVNPSAEEGAVESESKIAPPANGDQDQDQSVTPIASPGKESSSLIADNGDVGVVQSVQTTAGSTSGTSVFSSETPVSGESGGFEIEYLEDGESFSDLDTIAESDSQSNAVDTGIYTVYHSSVEYRIRGTDTVIYPSGGTTETVGKVIKMFGQNPATVVVRVRAVKSGSPPSIPFRDVDETDKNLVFSKSVIECQQADIGDDGTLTYSVVAMVEYKVIDSDKLELRPPVSPWVPLNMNSLVGVFLDSSLLSITEGN